jgi:uncharacterized protein YndB with AHSA1/START domain
MSDDDQGLTFSERIDAPAAAVYYAFTNAAALREWLCNDAQIDARAGGRVYLWWQQGYYTCGEFTALEPDKRAAFTWQGRNEPAVTEVQVSLAAANGRTQVTLAHTGVGAGVAWTEARRELAQGWESGLANLKAVLETGLDKRIYDQPFLGILIGGVVSEAQAAEMGLPVAGGIRINGTMPGSGAEAAGLQVGDVLASLGGADVTDFASLRAAVAPYRAGESIKMHYYRHGEKESAPMTLSRRPPPEVPETPAALAEATCDIYHELDAELDAIFQSVSETEASRPPAPGQWSAKELIAHLIATERVNLVDIPLLISGLGEGDFPHNPPAWTKAIVAVYPTVPELLAALKQAEAEIVALVAALPPEFVARKASYLHLGQWLMSGLVTHSRDHFAEMRAAIAAARESVGSEQ